MTEDLILGFGLRFDDLYGRDGLVRLDACFVDFLKARSPDLHGRLMAARATPNGDFLNSPLFSLSPFEQESLPWLWHQMQ